jgi:hypothetical protein
MPPRRHDDVSRARFRAENPLLSDVPDARLTHFAEAVDLPSDALQLVWVTALTAGDAPRRRPAAGTRWPRGRHAFSRRAAAYEPQ